MQEFIHGDVLVLNGDSPFLDPENIQNAWRQHHEQDCAVTVISAEVDDPTGYGRIVRDPDTRALQKSWNKRMRIPIPCKSGRLIPARIGSASPICCACWAASATKMPSRNTISPTLSAFCWRTASGPAHSRPVRARRSWGQTTAFSCTGSMPLPGRISCKGICKTGVEIPCLDGVILGPDVEIGAHVRILPGTILSGATQIGNACVIGPHTCLHEVQVADGMELRYVQARRCSITETLPPFTCIAPPEHRRHPHPHL